MSQNMNFVAISFELTQRWELYHQCAPAWDSLPSLVEALLRQHFDEADAVHESIKIQEATARYQVNKQRKKGKI